MGRARPSTMLINLVMPSPDRGSEVFDRTAIFRSGEIQVSETLVMGRSFLTKSTGNVVVVRVPSARTPAMACVPKDSRDTSGCGRVLSP